MWAEVVAFHDFAQVIAELEDVRGEGCGVEWVGNGGGGDSFESGVKA